MKGEKEMMNCPCGCHLGKGAHLYKLLGTVAIVFGLINYATVVLGWQSYVAWIAGGVLLVIIGMAKKHYYMMKMEK